MSIITSFCLRVFILRGLLAASVPFWCASSFSHDFSGLWADSAGLTRPPQEPTAITSPFCPSANHSTPRNFHAIITIKPRLHLSSNTSTAFNLSCAMSTSSKTTPGSPLSGANFNPLATHPFTSYSPPAPRAPPPPRNPAPTHSHNTTSRPTHSKPPKLSPAAGTPPIAAPVFVPYRPEAPQPELSQVLRRQPTGWKLPGQ
ncbi:hypothetical protein MVEN_01019100 [Mycena venus]|uniref:Uncharacterized protein n=1 Tax=Mycena venus TaxID=2733690 RepID=A0A8H6Y9G6_9AGAR|nr:hypothetical protein MVEN_01019100 [Mycena venus]